MTGDADHIDLDASMRLDKVTPTGRTETIGTDEQQRELLARRYGVTKVGAFSARVTLTRFRGGYRAQGVVEGWVVQPCVVTAEPVTQDISEPIDRVFLPGAPPSEDVSSGAEVFVNLERDDLPDYFEGDEIDLGELVMEVFAMAVDLYPRLPGAELPGEVLGDDPAELSPFAVLKNLRDDKGN
ncbi:YceD family protein [Pelagibacterium montanilacus]|uniref:YceD family protein n=1 Tax=Pelagibacterium montanilacus TaxID=2185280 RepID=UPI000F8D4101|nr:DUF177 domain-containing protein [Pelagibacterium montanilacus]